MEDPTSDIAENVSPEDAPVCRVCEASLADAPDRTVVTRVEDGEVRTVHFCDSACRAEWDGG